MGQLESSEFKIYLDFFREDENQNKSAKSKLDREVASAGLSYSQPPTPKDGSCLFHTLNDHRTCMGKLSFYILPDNAVPRRHFAPLSLRSGSNIYTTFGCRRPRNE